MVASQKVSLIDSLVETVDWANFWEVFRQYAFWDLEWFDGTNWVSVKEDLTINRAYPKSNHCKFTLIFNASKAGNYRLTFAVNKQLRDFIERSEKWQFDLYLDDAIITFDWSDCKDIAGLQFTHGIKDDYFWFRIRRDNVPKGAHLEIDPSLVGTSTVVSAVSNPPQRKSFYANGRFWVFYRNGTAAVYRTSTDGINWSSETSVRTTEQGYRIAISFDGTYVHYAITYAAVGAIYYRRGTPNSDGTITWSADEQTIQPSGYSYDHPAICVDSGGYAWIGARRYETATAYYYPVVLKNANNDGTWSTDFEYVLSTTSTSSWRVVPIALTNSKVYVIYATTSMYGKLYDSGWGSEESDCIDYTLAGSSYFSAIANGDDVHLAYNRATTYQIRYNKRTYGTGWDATDVLVQDSMESTSAPALSIDTSTGTLYCFWLRTDTDHVYYKKCVSGTWDTDPTDWADESTDTIQYGYLLTCFSKSYSNYIGLAYVTKSASPYNVKFAFLAVQAVYEIYVEAVAKSLSTFVPECIFNIQKDASVKSQADKMPEMTFNIEKDAVATVLADFLVEIVTGIVEIFKDAIAKVQAIFASESTFNVNRDAMAQALTRAFFEVGISKDAIVKASATGVYGVTFTLPLNAVVNAFALSALESTFRINPEATLKVLAEVSVVKEGEVKITKLFLILGNLAIQIQGN